MGECGKVARGEEVTAVSQVEEFPVIGRGPVCVGQRERAGYGVVLMREVKGGGGAFFVLGGDKLTQSTGEEGDLFCAEADIPVYIVFDDECRFVGGINEPAGALLDLSLHMVVSSILILTI